MNNTINLNISTNYYPFGSLMPNRYTSSGDYRYGFNGKENDDEVKGVTGSQQDYGFRIYDPRLGRFLSVDPLTASYPWYTPYQFAGNKPIWAIDLDGLEEYLYVFTYNDGNPVFVKKEYNLVWKDVSETSEQVHLRPYNKATGEKWNPEELGTVQYVYLDKDGKPMNIKRNLAGEFIEGKGDIIDDYSENWFGSIYIGPNNPQTEDGAYDYRREPQDEADKAALEHDKNYDDVEAVGASGVLSSKTTPADIELIKATQKTLNKGKGEKDAVTGKPVSTKTKARASFINKAFTRIVGAKAIGKELTK